MKHIVVISPDNPFLKRTGGQICDFAIITKLSEFFVVHVFTVVDSPIKELYPNIVIHRLSRRYDRISTYKGKVEFFLQLFFDLFPRSASIVITHNNHLLINNIICYNNISLVIYNHLESVSLKNIIAKNKILIHHNHESSLSYTLACKEKTLLKKIFYYLESCKLRYLEKTLRHSTFHHFALSADETQTIAGITHHPCDLFPVQICSKIMVHKTEEHFLYIFGNWDYLPSREGLERVINFMQYVDMPITLKVSGYCSLPEFVDALEQVERVEYMGFIEEEKVRYFLNKALVTIIPIFCGAGVKIKLVEALECNACILTTKKAIEGLPNLELLEGAVEFFEDLDDLSHKINLLTHSHVKRSSLRKNAYKYINYYRSLSDAVYDKIKLLA